MYVALDSNACVFSPNLCLVALDKHPSQAFASRTKPPPLQRGSINRNLAGDKNAVSTFPSKRPSSRGGGVENCGWYVAFEGHRTR